MKTDTIFYSIFLSFPGIFFELIDCLPEEADAYQFSSVEVKQLSFRIDGVFLPKTTAERPIYFAEVQFQLDETFYSRFFAEIFLYLDKTELKNNWRGVVVYPSRNIESRETERYEELLASRRVRRIYLDEISSNGESIGIETVKLVIEAEETAAEKARELIGQAREEITDVVRQRELLQLIETIIIYKFTDKSREEIAAMLGLGDLRQTRVFQEGKEEGKQEGKQEGMQQGKLEAVPFMLRLGATVEQIAEALNLKVEEVRQAAQQQSN
ncbi:MAG TPA: Rpn family recombination-promoting nuclease/putative transposase [Kamptonema sp.]|nr:Rpn family recombination-promoting nuclease/putative transposase [Kamptonema sp.]